MADQPEAAGGRATKTSRLSADKRAVCDKANRDDSPELQGQRAQGFSLLSFFLPFKTSALLRGEINGREQLAQNFKIAINQAYVLSAGVRVRAGISVTYLERLLWHAARCVRVRISSTKSLDLEWKF